MSINNVKYQINKDVLKSIISLNPEIEQKSALIEFIDYLEFDGDLINPKINFEALFHNMGVCLNLQDDWLQECVFEGNAIDKDYWISWNPEEEREQIMITLDLAKSLIVEANNTETEYLTSMLEVFEQAIEMSRNYLNLIDNLGSQEKTIIS